MSTITAPETYRYRVVGGSGTTVASFKCESDALAYAALFHSFSVEKDDELGEIDEAPSGQTSLVVPLEDRPLPGLAPEKPYCGCDAPVFCSCDSGEYLTARGA